MEISKILTKTEFNWGNQYWIPLAENAHNLTAFLHDVAPMCDDLIIKTGGSINYTLAAVVSDNRLIAHLDKLVSDKEIKPDARIFAHAWTPNFRAWTWVNPKTNRHADPTVTMTITAHKGIV